MRPTIFIKVIGFQVAKVGTQDAAEGVPYGLTDLTQALRTTLHPLMVRIDRD